MGSTAAATIRTPPVRFAGFLALALAVHGLLLLLPAQRSLQPGEVLNRLSVSLQSIATQRPTADAPANPVSPPPAATPVVAQPEPPVSFPEDATPPEPKAAPALPPPSSAPSTARLLDHAYRMRWQLPEGGDARRLGESWPGAGTDSPLSELFDRPTARPPAAAIEIVDRWLAADGSHNVLIRTPSGEMLCGRAEAWNPMRPLVEHVTMFRVCGNGEPTFEWPDRYRNSGPPPRVPDTKR